MGSVIYLRDVELFFVFLGFVLIIYAGIQSLLILLKVTKYLNIFIWPLRIYVFFNWPFLPYIYCINLKLK